MAKTERDCLLIAMAEVTFAIARERRCFVQIPTYFLIYIQQEVLLRRPEAPRITLLWFFELFLFFCYFVTSVNRKQSSKKGSGQSMMS